MKVALGVIIIGVCIISAIYFFLPEGMKKTINAVFWGSNTKQTTSQPSPTKKPVNATITPINLFPIVSPSPTLAPIASSPTPTTIKETTSPAQMSLDKTMQSSATNTALPSTGFSKQNRWVQLIAFVVSNLLLLLGIKLSKYKT